MILGTPLAEDLTGKHKLSERLVWLQGMYCVHITRTRTFTETLHLALALALAVDLRPHPGPNIRHALLNPVLQGGTVHTRSDAFRTAPSRSTRMWYPPHDPTWSAFTARGGGGGDQHSLSHPRGHGDFLVPSW